MEDNVIVIVFRFSYQTQQKLGNSLSVIVPAKSHQDSTKLQTEEAFVLMACQFEWIETFSTNWNYTAGGMSMVVIEKITRIFLTTCTD